MSAGAAIIVLWFLFCGWLAWKCVDLIRNAAPPDDNDDDWDDDWDDDLACTRCGGEGFCEVDDPMWDECDEYGWGPCGACHGTGSRKHQWVF